jgi:GWxTD domain-containing protein
MKPKLKCPAVFAVLIVALAGWTAAAENLPLLAEHAQWLEVANPIITKAEREVFFKLSTHEERTKFIQLFWKQRDTSPDTAENEFYKEYMARVTFADQNFGYGTGKKGSQTERGYYYLLLGPPLERQMYTTHSEFLPLEMWFCKGDTRFGLPPYFYLIFYQPMGMGEYRLYYPGAEGPEKLVIPSMSQQAVTRGSAFQAVKKVSSELASATLSYLPGERPQDASSFSSDQIIAGVRELPEKEFSDAYARNYLNYKDFVETEHTDNYTESTFLVKTFRTAGVYFIHWALEPSRVNFAERNDALYASFELVVRLEDSAGRSVYEQTEEIPLQITREQYKQHERQRFAFQDILPVIPGDYRVLFLLKNKTGRDFSSQETRLSIPREAGPLSLGPLLLYRAKDALKPGESRFLKAFALDGFQFLFDTRNEFPKDGTLSFYLQAFNLEKNVPSASAVSVQVEIRSAESKAVVWSGKRRWEEVMPAGRSGIQWEGIALAPLKPGYYEIEAAMVDASDKRLVSRKDHFILLTQAGAALPWVYSRQRPAFPSADQLNILGSEYLAVGDFSRAKDALEQSLALKDAGPTRLLLAKALYGLKGFKDSLAMIAPVYEATRDREAAKVMALDYAGLEDWSSALVYLKDLLKQATELGVLNLAGECLIRLGRADEALPLLRKSLELDPRQDEARKLMDQAQKAIK